MTKPAEPSLHEYSNRKEDTSWVALRLLSREVYRNFDDLDDPEIDFYTSLLLVLASALPIKLTTSRTETLQARRSCASSLETFIQSFLHRAVRKGVPGLP